MEKELLNLAKKYEKNREWPKAVECYEQYMSENPKSVNDKLYMILARCHRRIGNSKQAKKILTEGRTLYPDSEKILKEFFVLYDYIEDWDSAKSTAETLIEMNPKQPNYYFNLGRTHALKSDNEQAKTAYISGLKRKHRMTLAQLKEKIVGGFTQNASSVSSEYVFINGSNNLGGFIHNHGDKQYFTKISKYKRDARREEIFYKKISPKFPVLKEIVPKYINSQVIDNILYLTSEMIEGSSVKPKHKHINGVITISQKISSVKYNDIIEAFPNPNYLFQMKNKPGAVVIFFTEIHKKYYNEQMFSALYRLMKENNYPESVNVVIRQLESLIMENHLYTFINPEKHYSLLHGDFIPKNMLVNDQVGIPQVFDWASFTTGPHFIDRVRYLSSTLVPYSKVKEVYLNNTKTGEDLSLIEKIFFHYALILLYILRVKENQVEKYMDDYVLPTLDSLEELIIQFKENSYDHIIKLLINEKIKNEEKQVKVLKLKNKVTKTTTKYDTLQKQFKNILSSKSWKTTAPLRAIVQRIQRK